MATALACQHHPRTLQHLAEWPWDTRAESWMPPRRGRIASNRVVKWRGSQELAFM